MNPQAPSQAEQSASTDVQDRARRRLLEWEEQLEKIERLEQLRRYFQESLVGRWRVTEKELA